MNYQSWMETKKLLEPEEIIELVQAGGAQIVVIEADFIFEEVFESASNLRFVGVCRSAVNNVDIKSATEHGVIVVNTPGRNSVGVAELTVGVALSLARRISEANDLIRSGRWVDPVGPYISMRGIELQGKVVGIVGFGAIGKEVAKRFQAFGMTILVHDPYVEKSVIEAAGAKTAELNILLKESDIVSIHCSATEATRGLIGKDRVNLLKRSAYLINAASWEVVDEEALFTALEKRSIAGAAFDVFSTHPLSSQSPLLKLNNVILTPHIGGATDGTITRYSKMMADDIIRFTNGLKPLNIMNPEVWKGNAG